MRSIHSLKLFRLIKTPLGDSLLVVNRENVLRLIPNVQNRKNLNSWIKNLSCKEANRKNSLIDLAEKQLFEYFSSEREYFDLPIALKTDSEFEKKVWRQLREIPFGQTQSYKEVALAIGHPKSYRAVGNANGKNPMPVIIPCHRVINQDGTLGGYTGGIKIKQQLLKLENSLHGPL